MKEFVGILLAAGRSRRFGSDKLQHLMSDGRPMAVVAAGRLLPACDRVLAVWAPGSEALAESLADGGCETLCCPRSVDGMGHSLAAAVGATPDAAGWIVALGDMPYIGTSTHERVSEALRAGASIVTVENGGRRGHPVGFSRAHFAELVALTGDQGARQLLAKHAAEIVCLTVTDPGIHRDIDTPADLIPL